MARTAKSYWRWRRRLARLIRKEGKSVFNDDYDDKTRASLEISRSFKKIDGESPPWEE